MERLQRRSMRDSHSPLAEDGVKRMVKGKKNQRANAVKNLAKAMRKQKNRGVANINPTARGGLKPFGAVSSITTAPVAIGNSIKGSRTQVVQTSTGVRVRGRDFMFAPIGTGTVATWTVAGGSPLTPAAFTDSVVANYLRTYSKFKWRGLTAHYITASPTTATGDVMFYYNKDRSSVFLNQTSSQFMPFVISDPNTMLGPQWMNHSSKFDITGDWKLCDYGMHDGIEEYAAGDLFLMSKTSTTPSPGYILFDYDIEFSELQLQPRLLTFPISRIQWQQMNIGLTAVAVVPTNPVSGSLTPKNKGNGISGAASVNPFQPGDIVKIIVDLTNSLPASWTSVTSSSLFAAKNGQYLNALTIQDGTTFYGVYDNGETGFALYANPTQAYDGGQQSVFFYAINATITYNLQCWVSYIGSSGSSNMNPNF
jgi:hypothetical protein